MTDATSSGPNGCFARLVLVLVLLTGLITIAAAILFVLAIIPMPEALRPWLGLALFLFVGGIIVIALLNRARSGESAIRQQMARLFGPLGLTLQESGEQAGTYAGVYQGHEVRADYAISGTPQKPAYHLEIAVRAATSFRLAAGMARFQLEFDEKQFGQPLPLADPDYAELIAFTDDPDAARALLASPRAKKALLDLLSSESPGVRNITMADNAVTLRYRHHSMKQLNPRLVKRWVDDLIAFISKEHSD
jgi:hypothetical protein